MVMVRAMQPGEDDALGQVMWDAIHKGRSRYDAAQRSAWLATPPRGARWSGRLAAQDVWVAQGPGGPVGFITLGAGGYVDLAYVSAQVQGAGIFGDLYGVLEGAARRRGMGRLSTHASLMAQPAFARVGFHVLRHETVARAGQPIARAEMEKVLT